MPFKNETDRVAWSAKYYKGHRKTKIEKEAVVKAKKQLEHKHALAYMSGDVCPVCDEYMKPPVFHHVDPSTKHYNVSRMGSICAEKIYREINLCEIMCRSCHNKERGENYEKN